MRRQEGYDAPRQLMQDVHATGSLPQAGQAE